MVTSAVVARLDPPNLYVWYEWYTPDGLRFTSCISYNRYITATGCNPRVNERIDVLDGNIVLGLTPEWI